ncbi:hypothetical protein Vadar_025783 [Vaccinium darrowii]|uniref:Uncharacterized protein n=1 Tax=Vaccinium darrowii TaxID=229202 RepID=A0ACB7XT73_9ERIC|nr:hypothetical protein Vadar_025783 [Vaccinium darrowii]
MGILLGPLALIVLCHQVIAESLSEEEIAGFREMFKAMDADNSSAITFDELKAGLRKYGSTLKDTEIRDLMDVVRRLFPTSPLKIGIPRGAKNPTEDKAGAIAEAVTAMKHKQ